MPDVTMGPGGPTDLGTGTSPMGTTTVERKLDTLKGMPYEGRITRRVERQTAKLPSLFYLATAGLAVAGSITLFALRRPLSAIFVGLWPPVFLLIGNYNKLVKLENELAPTATSITY